MNVLMQGDIAANACDSLKVHAEPHWNIDSWHPQKDNLDRFVSLASEADVIIGGNIPTPNWPATPHLKLFQIPWAGYNFTSPDKFIQGLPVANCFEHESAIAEYVMLAMLETQIGIGKMDSQFRNRGWAGRVVGSSGNYHGEILGKTLGIIGYGHIAEAVAKRAAAFDMKVMAVRRTVNDVPAPLSWLGTPDQLNDMLAQSDFVLIACDLNDATHHLINSKTLAAMKDNTVLINVSRGDIIDEKSLFEALSSKQIGGAVLDVWYNYNSPDLTTDSSDGEVWPCNLPFQELDNTILTAHESGWTEAQVNRRWQFVAQNIARVERGEKAQNIVFTGTQ